ncbi:MAG: GAP family protein [Solirubrobacteraceae bacterium]
MLAAATVVAALGVADSINPVTILVAMYLGSGPDPARRLGGFISGVFTAYLIGGLALMLGPAELLRGGLAGVEIPGMDAAALVAGVGLMAVAVAVWTRRNRLARVRLPDGLARPRSALALGALVTVLDLPTAFPYFGAIAVIVNGDMPMVAQLILLGLFNALYVLPLALVLVAHLAFGARSHALLARVRAAVARIAAPLLAAGAGAAGAALVARGAGGVLG